LRPEATVILPDEPITLRRVERLLRDAGLPRKFVKALLAGGWQAAAGQEDAADAEAEAAALVKAMDAACERLRRMCNGLQWCGGRRRAA
jgi:hypothetical protein